MKLFNFNSRKYMSIMQRSPHTNLVADSPQCMRYVLLFRNAVECLKIDRLMVVVIELMNINKGFVRYELCNCRKQKSAMWHRLMHYLYRLTFHFLFLQCALLSLLNSKSLILQCIHLPIVTQSHQGNVFISYQLPKATSATAFLSLLTISTLLVPPY